MSKKHQRWGWVFVSPYLIGFIIFTFVAVLFSGYVSFTDYNLIRTPNWIGIKNYSNILKDPAVWASFRNVLIYGLLVESMQLVFGCILAVLMNVKTRGMGVYRTAFFIPGLVSMVAVSFVWTYMYNPSYGIFNYVFSYLGIGPFKYTFSSNWFEFLVSIAFMNTWRGLGYIILYLLGALQNISTDVIEASMIDGAGRIRRFFSITLPLITPTIFFLLVIGVINSIQAFDSFYVMVNNAETGANIESVGMLIYNHAFVYNEMGIAAAISWVSFAVMAILTVMQKKLEKRYVHYA